MWSFFKRNADAKSAVRSFRDGLIWAGGGNSHVATTRAPKSIPLFVGIGSIVCLVSLIAVVTGTLSSHLVFGYRASSYLPLAIDWAAPLLPVVLGLVYGLLVFSLDRLLVATTPSFAETASIHAGSKWSNIGKWFSLFLSVAARFAIAFFLAHQIAVLTGTLLLREEILKKQEQVWVNNQIAIIQQAQEKWDEDIDVAFTYAETQLEAASKTFALLSQSSLNNANNKSNVNVATSVTKTGIANTNALNQISNLRNLYAAASPAAKSDIQKAINSFSNLQTTLENNSAQENVASAALAEQSKRIAGLETLKLRQWEAAKSSAENSLKQLTTQITARNEWLNSQPTRDRLHQYYSSCDSNGNVKNVQPSQADRVCGRSQIGVLTMISEFHKIKKELSPKESSWKEDAIDLLTYSLIALELLAILTKLLVGRGRYVDELNDWEATQAITQRTKESADALRIAAQYLSSGNKATVISLSEDISETQKELALQESSVLTAKVDSWASAGAFIGAIANETSKFNTTAQTASQMPSAWALDKNLKYMTDRYAVHSLLPRHELMPTADSLAIQFNGSILKTAVTVAIVFLSALIVHAAYIFSLGTNFDVKELQWVVYLMIAATAGAIAFFTTSPGFSNSIKPSVWTAGFVVAITLAVFGLISRFAGLPFSLPPNITDGYGRYFWSIPIASALAFLVILTGKFFKNQFPKSTRQQVD